VEGGAEYGGDEELERIRPESVFLHRIFGRIFLIWFFEIKGFIYVFYVFIIPLRDDFEIML
jgi:hypothetical protein